MSKYVVEIGGARITCETEENVVALLRAFEDAKKDRPAPEPPPDSRETWWGLYDANPGCEHPYYAVAGLWKDAPEAFPWCYSRQHVGRLMEAHEGAQQRDLRAVPIRRDPESGEWVWHLGEAVDRRGAPRSVFESATDPDRVAKRLRETLERTIPPGTNFVP